MTEPVIDPSTPAPDSQAIAVDVNCMTGEVTYHPLTGAELLNLEQLQADQQARVAGLT